MLSWTLEDVEAGKEGTVTLTVKVLEGALESKGGEGKVVNGGESTTVKVGNDKEYTLKTVENPVPEEPHKKETAPYEGTGELGGVHVGDEITYEISYRNYKSEEATVVIKDTLDPKRGVCIRIDGGAYDEDGSCHLDAEGCSSRQGRHGHPDREGTGRRAGVQRAAKARSSTAATPQ